MRGSIIYLEPEWEKEVRMLQEVPLQQGWCSKSWIATYKKLSMLIAPTSMADHSKQNLLSAYGQVYFHKVLS